MNKNLFNRILELSGLYEDLDTMRDKSYQDIPREEFKEIVLLDPTATAERPGKYFKDLINLHKKGKITNLYKDGLKHIMSKALDDVILSKNISWLFNLYVSGNLKTEDLYKASLYLDKYNTFKKEIGKPLNSYRNLPQLFTDVEQYLEKEKEVEVSEKNQAKKEAKKVYEDDEWLVVIPETHRAACIYGAGTQWCTAGKNDYYFNDYNSEGPLYILINKQEKDKEGRQVKYQFHFPSQQFMDVKDRQINKESLFNDLNDSIKQFFIDVNFSKLKNFDKETNTITFEADFDTLVDGFDREYRSFAENVLTGNTSGYFEMESENVKDILKYLEIDEENKNNIESYLDKNYPEWRAQNEDLEDFINTSSYANDVIDAIVSANRRAREHAAESEAYNDIINSIEDYFGPFKFIDDGVRLNIDVSNNYNLFFAPFIDLGEYWSALDDRPLNYSEPYNGYDGSIDDSDFNEALAETINELPAVKRGVNHPDQLRFDGMESERILFLAGVKKLV
jgi:hypothetical protein